MELWKKSPKGSKGSKYPLGSASNSTLASRLSDSDPRSEQQPSGEQMGPQAALSPPTVSSGGRLSNKSKRNPSPSPGVECHNNKTNIPVAVLPQSTAGPDVITPSPCSSIVCTKALDIANKKLSDSNLYLRELTSRSAERKIEAVIKALNTSQEDDKKKRWSYTWRGKEVIVVERLGKILGGVEKYSKIVNTAIQSNPQVSGASQVEVWTSVLARLVWASVWDIVRVCIQCTLMH